MTADVLKFRFRMDTFRSLAQQVVDLISALDKPCALFLLPQGRVLVLDAVCVPDEAKRADPPRAEVAYLRKSEAEGHYVGTYRPGSCPVTLCADMRRIAGPLAWHP